MKLTREFTLEEIAEALQAKTSFHYYEFVGPYAEHTYSITQEERFAVTEDRIMTLVKGDHTVVFDPTTQSWIAYQGPDND